MFHELNKQLELVEGVSPAGSRSSRSRRNSCGSTPTKILPKMLTADEVADLLRKSAKTIYRWANEGLIPSFNLHGNVLFDLDEVLAWIEGHRMAA
jgi:excisionase family DNA binding protein